MSNSKKLLIALAVICAVGATPLAAQYAGNWMGTGTGFCYPVPGTVIYPWQNWDGFIPATQDVFTGSWVDNLGNQGTFDGTVSFQVSGAATSRGTWTWLNPATGILEYGGDFGMTFCITDAQGYVCDGIWVSIWPPPTTPQGTMQGKKR